MSGGYVEGMSNGYETTLYQEAGYLIQKKGPGWYRFIHRCPHNQRGERIWRENERKLHKCDWCKTPVPPHMFFLWEMIDRNFP